MAVKNNISVVVGTGKDYLTDGASLMRNDCWQQTNGKDDNRFSPNNIYKRIIKIVSLNKHFYIMQIKDNNRIMTHANLICGNVVAPYVFNSIN